jgi:L-seryl-tRNA(Ser) seleniumtransferase
MFFTIASFDKNAYSAHVYGLKAAEPMSKHLTQNALLRSLPSVDAVLRTATAATLRKELSADQLSHLARTVTDDLRSEILTGAISEPGNSPATARAQLLAEAERQLALLHRRELMSGLRRVINATGVVLHTNIGRAPLSTAARRALSETAAGYCTLEYDTVAGTRGRRGGRVEDLLAYMAKAEAALVVNNCAAAALLVLTTLANESETIVSRGELVEIGGDFRVPDVMAQSGTRMIEVGTTNRTRLSDYRKAISESTRLIMRVHTSNYRIVGFTRTPALNELADLAHSAGLLLYEDAGSGALFDLTPLGIEGEPVIRSSIEAGADVVTFSGDKLLGGPQAGLIVGSASVIERMRNHPLYRALRADKLCLAALEATLDSYARESASEDVPVHRLLGLSAEGIEKRAKAMIKRLLKQIPPSLHLEIIVGESAAGGGSAPTAHLRTSLISLAHEDLTPNQIEEAMRQTNPPVITRIVDDQVLLDLRTVEEDDEPLVEQAILSLPC